MLLNEEKHIEKKIYLGMQRFKLFIAWSYAVSRSKTITGLKEQAVKRKPFQEKNQFNENRSKRKNDLTKTGLREKAV